MSGLVDLEPVRHHVRSLRASGASWQTIATAAGIGTMTVADLMARRQRVTEATAEAILAVRQSDLDLARLNANGAMLRLRSLQAMGHGSARVARAIGYHEQTVSRVVSGQARTISVGLHRAIHELFEAWWDKRPPEITDRDRAAASAARHRAERHDWCLAAALDEELLDSPGYVPQAGYRPALGTGVADDFRLIEQEAEAG